MMKTKNLILLSGLLLGHLFSQAQSTWSLEKCIEYARQNNLSLRQSQLSIDDAKLGLQSSRMRQHPSLDGSASGGLQFGRTIDPTTNSFDNQTIGFNQINVNGSILLYNGGQLKNAVQGAKMDVAASEADAAANFNVIALNIANAYLQVLLNQEQLSNAQEQKRLSEAQLAQINRFIEIGTAAPNARFDVEAQLTRNQQSIVQLSNAVKLAKLNLIQLMQLSTLESLDIDLEVPNIKSEPFLEASLVDGQLLYQEALNKQPQIIASGLRAESATIAVERAKGTMLPTVSMFASLSTSYSSVARDFANPNTDNIQVVANTPEPVLINGNANTLTTFGVTGLEFPNKTYGNQFTENFGQSVGMSVRVPIYNSGQGRINTQRAMVSRENSMVQLEQARVQLQSDIQTAVANATAAKEGYEAAKAAQIASKAAFENTQKRFSLGASNTLEVTTSQGNLQIADNDVVRTKYEYLFRLKILDFYMGRPITLD